MQLLTVLHFHGEVDGQSVLPWHNRWGGAQLLGEAQTRCVSCVVAATAAPQGRAHRWIHRCSARTAQPNSFLVSHTSIRVSQCVFRFKPLQAADNSVFHFSVFTSINTRMENTGQIRLHRLAWQNCHDATFHCFFYVDKGRETQMFKMYVCSVCYDTPQWAASVGPCCQDQEVTDWCHDHQAARHTNCMCTPVVSLCWLHLILQMETQPVVIIYTKGCPVSTAFKCFTHSVCLIEYIWCFAVFW